MVYKSYRMASASKTPSCMRNNLQKLKFSRRDLQLGLIAKIKAQGERFSLTRPSTIQMIWVALPNETPSISVSSTRYKASTAQTPKSMPLFKPQWLPLRDKQTRKNINVTTRRRKRKNVFIESHFPAAMRWMLRDSNFLAPSSTQFRNSWSRRLIVCTKVKCWLIGSGQETFSRSNSLVTIKKCPPIDKTQISSAHTDAPQTLSSRRMSFKRRERSTSSNNSSSSSLPWRRV